MLEGAVDFAEVTTNTDIFVDINTFHQSILYSPIIFRKKQTINRASPIVYRQEIIRPFIVVPVLLSCVTLLLPSVIFL